ncbi:hypothetical protein [Algibacter sp. L3A6]|uniref:hypothetical protein n=1 Tax=Algibacter sp. L3A6 TaxID=2686366 RepID=UPI001E2EDBF6|nr:hypothetical protein [Algibacter sp. L3A6]
MAYRLQTSASLFINASGHYEVYIDPNNGDCALEGEAYVNFNENPEAFDYTLLQCDEDGLKDDRTTFVLTQANEALTGKCSRLRNSFLFR